MIGRRDVCLRIALAVALPAAWAAAASAAEPLVVFVGVPPYAELVERIGGDRVEVHVLVQPGQDPHTFEPTPRQMLALAKASVFFHAGLPFEERLAEKIRQSRRALAVVDLGQGVAKRPLAGGCGHGDHGPGGCPEHAAGVDPHIWLAPPLLKLQARTIAEALESADPSHGPQYRENLSALLGDIEATHARIAAALGPLRGQSFYVYHAAFGYFGDAYGLKQQAVEVGGRSPSPKQLRAVVARAKAQRVRILFVQPQFDQRSAQIVAGAIGGAVVPIDPLAAGVLENLERTAAEIRQAVSP